MALLGLQSVSEALNVLKNASKNIVGQIIILYSDYSETVFKPKPIINLSPVSELVLQVTSEMRNREIFGK